MVTMRKQDGGKYASSHTKKELCAWLDRHRAVPRRRKSKKKKSRRSSSNSRSSSSSSRSRSVRSIAKILAKKPKDCYKLKAKDLRKFVKAAGHPTRYDGQSRSVKKMCGSERRHYRKQAEAGNFEYPYDSSEQSELEYEMSKLLKAKKDLEAMIAKVEAQKAAKAASGASSSDGASIAAAAAAAVLSPDSSDDDAASVSSSQGESGVSVAEANSATGQGDIDVIDSADDLLRMEQLPNTPDGYSVMFEGKRLRFDKANKKFVPA